MIPLNSYFQTFGDDFVLHGTIVGNDGGAGERWRFVNVENDIKKLKSDYQRAYRLAHESTVRMGFIFLHNREIPICSHVSIYNPFDRKWVSVVTVIDDVTADKMESITIQAISDCNLKMQRSRGRS